MEETMSKEELAAMMTEAAEKIGMKPEDYPDMFRKAGMTEYADKLERVMRDPEYMGKFFFRPECRS